MEINSITLVQKCIECTHVCKYSAYKVLNYLLLLICVFCLCCLITIDKDRLELHEERLDLPQLSQ